MKRVAAKFGPKFLNFEQKQRRMEVAQESLTMPQPLYLPDMAPCDFFLFPKIKTTLEGRRFTAIDDIKSASLKELKAIPKIEFEKGFEDWKKRWPNTPRITAFLNIKYKKNKNLETKCVTTSPGLSYTDSIRMLNASSHLHFYTIIIHTRAKIKTANKLRLLFCRFDIHFCDLFS